jgi:hypothetical protein
MTYADGATIQGDRNPMIKQPTNIKYLADSATLCTLNIQTATEIQAWTLASQAQG